MKILKALFVILFPVTFSVLLVESITYKNVFLKYAGLSSDVLLGTELLLGIVVLISIEKYKNTALDKIINLYIKLSFFGTVTGYIAYFTMTIVDNLNYKNFIFSKYHIQPDLFLRPILLLLFLSVVTILIKKLLQKDKPIHYFLNISFVSLIMVFGINNLVLDFTNLIPNVVTILKTARLNNDEMDKYAMHMKYGQYYDNLQIVKQIVAENESILLPPQKNPWQFEGNQRLDRYFLYPRTLYSSTEVSSLDNLNYILITWGSDVFPPAQGETYGWPNYKINSKEIYIFDATSETYKTYNGNYDPKIYLKSGVFGLIKIK